MKRAEHMKWQVPGRNKKKIIKSREMPENPYFRPILGPFWTQMARKIFFTKFGSVIF